MKSHEKGLTLVEVMIGLLLFTAALSMATDFVREGVDQPFAVFGPEAWVCFIEETSNAILTLEDDFTLGVLHADHPRLKQIQKPADLSSWKLEWRPSSIPGVEVAEFSATTSHHHTYQWRIHKISHEL